MQTTNSDFIDIMEKNHMEIPWHDYANDDSNVLIAEAGLIEKASVIGRVGLIMLSCGTGAWRVRTSMNRLSKELGVTCTVDVGLMSIVFNCFDGNDCISQSLSIANTGVNTSKLYRMEQFVDHFPEEEAHMTGEDIHKRLDEIEEIHALYSPAKLGLAAALACCGFTFLLGGGPVEMALAFIAAGIGNLIRTKLIKHHYTLFLNIAVSVFSSMFYLCSLSETCGTLSFTFRNFMKLVISARCCSSSRDFHLLQAGSTLQTGSAFGTGAAYLCNHYRYGCHFICMDHGFTSASGTGRFYGTASKCCCPSDFPCDCKLLRSIRFLDHVQQFSFDGGNGCIYWCHCQYTPA